MKEKNDEVLDTSLTQTNTRNSFMGISVRSNNNYNDKMGTGEDSYYNTSSSVSSSIDTLFQYVGYCHLCKTKLPYWDPEDKKQWEIEGGKHIAHRNLLISMPNLMAAFGVWLSWSVIVPKIQLMHDKDPNVYQFQDFGSPTGSAYRNLLWTLPAVAGLSGGTLRVVNSFMTQIVGGRNVVAHSSIMLTITMMITSIALQNKDTPFTVLLVAAWLSGTGGGAFASSMSNMSFLYPKANQGYCLGFNGGIGNLGVSLSQFLCPIVMAASFGNAPLSDKIEGWPNHAGWLWWPFCVLFSFMAFTWMNNLPEHGNHPGRNDAIWNIIYYYWFESLGLGVAAITIVILIQTRELPIFVNTTLGGVGDKFLLVIIALVLAHLALRYLSPLRSRKNLHEQNQIFKDKHTWIMTIIYTMSFGSFIGFSGAFPKLIQDLFGYISTEGCFYTAISNTTTGILTNVTTFVEEGTQHDCVNDGGMWGLQTVTNPNAPDVFKYAWLGALIGSVIRPFGGIIADWYGGAKVTQILIIWCTVTTFILAVLIQTTKRLKHPEFNFTIFVFLFLNVFLSVGAMNGTTFRTIGVLFDAKQAGPVLGWSSAVASYGAFIIPSMFALFSNAGKPEMTLYIIGSFYICCGVLNYYYYERPGTDKPGV